MPREYTRRPEAERFWAKVTKSKNGCWIWNGSSHCVFWSKDQKMVRVCIWAYLSSGKKIPEGWMLKHRCNNRLRCVNPEHMTAVSKRELHLTKLGPMGINAAKTRCNRGHELSGDNLIVQKSGKRTCRQCQRITGLAFYYRKRAKMKGAKHA